MAFILAIEIYMKVADQHQAKLASITSISRLRYPCRNLFEVRGCVLLEHGQGAGRSAEVSRWFPEFTTCFTFDLWCTCHGITVNLKAFSTTESKSNT